MTLRKRLIAFASFVFAACGGSPATPSGTETITGIERFGWDQPAADAGELASFRYALYVDDARSEAADVSCALGQPSGQFICTSRLPTMSSGVHTLQVAAFAIDGGAIRESARSSAVRVLKR
ncbi:MAG TPA: hypothetical protein VEL51_01725 [Vicinamibacterales bacterium]|nr:hypothetical protein [Vicinamibacterales bacterium]